MRLTVADLRLRSLALRRKLHAVKANTRVAQGVWYPYDIFGNLKRLWRCNGMTGIRALCASQNARVAIHEFDVDSCLPLPAGSRSLAMFLGTLYHLKNPLGALERLREACGHCILSTRIAQGTADSTVQFGDQPLAYLLGRDECNRDATNYWIFSYGGLVRLAARAGWTVERSLRHGATRGSDPSNRDERAYLLLRRA